MILGQSDDLHVELTDEGVDVFVFEVGTQIDVFILIHLIDEFDDFLDVVIALHFSNFHQIHGYFVVGDSGTICEGYSIHESYGFALILFRDL